MGYFGIPFRNGVPIGLGSVVSFGAQQFDPSELFVGGTAGAWYDPSDLSTMFTTSAGTTPVAMPGLGSAVSVGLMLDKSQNGVGTNGAKRVNLLTYSEQFNLWPSAGTTVSANATTAPDGTLTADKMVETATTGLHYRLVASLTTQVASYTLSVSAKAAERKWLILWYSGSGGFEPYAYFDLENGVIGNKSVSAVASILPQNNGFYRCQITITGQAISNASFVVSVSDADNNNPNQTYLGDSSKGIFVWGADLRLTSEASTLPTYQRIDANWYSTMAGNHAIAFNDTTARPELRARVNLLTYSEEFDNAAWVNASTAITANTAVAPNNTTTADTLTNLITGFAYFGRTAITPAASTDWSIAVKYSGSSQWFLMNFGAGATTAVWFDIQNGLVGTQASGSVGSIQALGNGWYRCTVRRTTSLGGDVYCACADADNSTTATAGKNVFIWGADLRPANIGANVPAYQRIADANTYDTSGFPLYLRFDGIDDSMYTPANLNLSGTDKVAVFAGVRKLSDAAQGVVAELSATIASNNGTFLLAAPDGATQTYGWDSKGTTQVDAVASSLAAPRTNVLVGTADIAGDSCIIRVNGAVADTEAGDQGTGNYGTYPLFIGARNNASIWFNGHLHSLIIAGSAVSAGNISATEQWVAGKTGITI